MTALDAARDRYADALCIWLFCAHTTDTRDALYTASHAYDSAKEDQWRASDPSSPSISRHPESSR